MFRRTFICEASELKEIPDGTYDCVLPCHSLEHIANPVKAMCEWRRVLRKDGFMLLVLPNKQHTFDWRRPVTTLEHMIQDYRNDTGENDLTHLEEILALHDLSKDLGAGTYEQFKGRCLNNKTVRAIHHHVFTIDSVLELVKYAGFSPLLSELHLPYDIIVLTRRSELGSSL